MGAAAERLEVGDDEGLSEDMLAFVDHLAELLAEDHGGGRDGEAREEECGRGARR